MQEFDRQNYLNKNESNNSDHSTTNLSAVELNSVHDDNFEDANLYFGEEAKENFWDLYKSDRRFKDYDQEHDEIRDPRFAYLKTCRDLKVFPKARMVIREKQTNHINYSNFQMLDKNAVAVAETIKRYALPIESMNLTNNCLKSKQCIMLIDSLQRHYQKLQNLKLSKNKLGLDGSKHLASAIKQMKSLTHLDLSENEIGDVGVNEIINACKDYGLIEYLDLSGNNIGKTSYSNEVAENLYQLIVGNNTLEILKINWNNIRGQVGEKIIEGLIGSTSIREVHMNNNLLGVAYDDKQPPISKIAEFLSSSKTIEYLDLSYNFIEQKSIFCIAHGLKFTGSLKNITVEGNPIGPVGMRFLIQAMSTNSAQDFKVNMKEISADRDVNIYKNVFDTNNPEKTYSLNLAETYDHIILQSLLIIAEKAVLKSEGKFDIKQCFQGVKLNGKPNWTPPATKDSFGQFEVQEHTGTLTFTFTINPILYKQQQQKLQQQQEQQPQQNPNQQLQVSPQKQHQQEILEVEFLLKPLLTHQGFERVSSMIIQFYNDEDEYNLEELIKSLAKEYMIWSSQAFEIMYAYKNLETFAQIAPQLINRVIDRQNRFYLISHFQLQTKRLMTKLYNRMGQSYYFNFWNPNGHYELNLSNQVERDIAMTLIVKNKEASMRILSGERADRSQMGNKSCFRNEKFNSQPFVMKDDWVLPQNGILEFDFMSLNDRPNPQDELRDEQVHQMIEWFKTKYEVEKTEILALAIAFQQMTEFIVLRSEQLALFIDLIDDPTWKTEIYISGIARISDFRNYDFIKHRVKYPEAIRDIYKRFGILNLFNPFRPNGSYRLDLAIYEERTVCKMLLELAKTEGYAQFTNVSLDGKSTESISKEFVDKLGDSGIFEGTYICQPINIKEEIREKVGQKYLDWDPL